MSADTLEGPLSKWTNVMKGVQFQRFVFDEEFMNLKRRCDQEARDKHLSLEASKTLDNRKFNRYRDVNPYDHSRIVLGRSAATGTDYINANLVKCERADRQYILTQGPLPLTVSHFWLMAWEQKSKAILMLNKLVEKKVVKCHQYWPSDIGASHRMRLEDVGLQVDYTKYEEFDNFSIRTILLTDTVSGESREVLQFHYTTWPDFGIPSSPDEFLRFLKIVRDSGAISNDVGPAIVHCSAGIGRSGTFCLVDCCLTLAENRDSPDPTLSVSNVLSELRSYRMGLIQTPDQLFFSYQAIIDGLKCFNDENWRNTPINSTIKYYEGADNGATVMDETPPPLPPPRSESLTNTNSIPPRNGTAESNNNSNKWGQPPLPMIPIEEDEATDGGSSADSETDVESCKSSNEDDDQERATAAPDNDVQRQTAEATTTKAALMEHSASNNGGDSNNSSADYDDRHDQAGMEDAAERDNTLRRRGQREEKQQLMADKVKDIKRKQREVEEGVVASKKRRSLLVKITLAAVLIGFVCICYSRK